MYDKHILTERDCRSIWDQGRKVGYCVNIRINYYRGLPLSCIDSIALDVDGESVDPKQMTIQTGDREYPYTDILKDFFPTDVYWQFGDDLRIVVNKDGGIEQGRHRVKLTLGTRRSYTPTMVSVCEKTLTFA